MERIKQQNHYMGHVTRSSSNSLWKPKTLTPIMSETAAKYTPQTVPVSNTVPDDPDLGKLRTVEPSNDTFQAPDRFAFFCTTDEMTIHSPELPSLLRPHQSFFDLFKQGEPTWWLDCTCPTDEEMHILTTAFGIHPLTAEDVRMQEPRGKVEMFKTYYFISFHTFVNDKNSPNFLERICIYIIVFKNGILSFHFSPVDHCSNVRRRVRQLKNYVNVNADWICYALIDDITDSFAPVIQSIEYQTDAFDDTVLMTYNADFSKTLQNIGNTRRNIMTLMRLLSGKADVVKMLAKRCRDESKDSRNYNTINSNNPSAWDTTDTNSEVSLSCLPGGNIAMYLGDIQDHLLTMQQSLRSYENILARSHSNYLAQLQVESFISNNKVGEILGKVTILGTMLIPLNVITGLFGMNVEVPGGKVKNLAWFFGILGVLFAIGIFGWFLASFWVTAMNDKSNDDLDESFDENEKKASKSKFQKYLPKWFKKKEDITEDYTSGSALRIPASSVHSTTSTAGTFSHYSRTTNSYQHF